MVKYVLSSPWDSEKRNFDLFVCLVYVKKLTIKLTLTLTLTLTLFILGITKLGSASSVPVGG